MMNLCDCTNPIVDPDDLSCALCGRTTVAALERRVIRVDPLDRLLKYRKAIAYQAAMN